MSGITFAILTVSDTCYTKIKEDKSGPKLAVCVKLTFPNCSILSRDIVADNKDMISAYLLQWAVKGCNVILTTGGTGFSCRDVTPEATRAVIEKEAPGLCYGMISKSLEKTELAMLSRAVCGIKYNTIIINLPGSVKGATECFDAVKNAIPHAVALIKGNKEKVDSDHAEIQNINECISPSKVKIKPVAFRNRKSPYPLVEVSEALKLIFSNCPKFPATEVIDISESLNRVLAEDVHSKHPLPPFNASTKDGYAVRFMDGIGTRKVRDVIIAGDSRSRDPLAHKEAIRINTGAPIPEGADAVVQVEDTILLKASPDGKDELEIEIKVAPRPLQDIRPIGSELKTGALVLAMEDQITAGHIGVLASVGKTKVKVYRRPVVGVISTGNELQKPSEKLNPGHIFDSNTLSIINLLKQYGFQASDCGLAKDNTDSVKQTLAKALSFHDVIITSGGVSMGEFDILKNVLIEDLQAIVHFGRVLMKPGKPTTFATCFFDGKPKIIFALPGNPVSAMVTTILFVIPALRRFENNKHTSFPKIPVALGVDYPIDPRPEYVRVRFNGITFANVLKAYPVGNQISSRIGSFVNAHALLYLPNDVKNKVCHKEGEIFEAYIMGWQGVE